MESSEACHDDIEALQDILLTYVYSRPERIHLHASVYLRACRMVSSCLWFAVKLAQLCIHVRSLTRYCMDAVTMQSCHHRTISFSFPCDPHHLRCIRELLAPPATYAVVDELDMGGMDGSDSELGDGADMEAATAAAACEDPANPSDHAALHQLHDLETQGILTKQILDLQASKTAADPDHPPTAPIDPPVFPQPLPPSVVASALKPHGESEPTAEPSVPLSVSNDLQQLVQ